MCTSFALQRQGAFLPRGPRADLLAMGASEYAQYIQQEMQTPEIFEQLQAQVLDRTLMYHRRCLPDQFLKENMREWDELCSMCEARALGKPGAVQVPERPDYPFVGLLDSLAHEWLNKKLSIGGLASLRKSQIADELQRWIRQGMERDSVSGLSLSMYFRTRIALSVRVSPCTQISTPLQQRLATPVVTSSNSVNQKLDGISSLQPADVRRTVVKAVEGLLGEGQVIFSGKAQLMDLGLDSLAATQLTRELSHALEMQLPMTVVFDYPTVDALCEHLAAELVDSSRLTSHIDVEESEALLPSSWGTMHEHKVGFQTLVAQFLSARSSAEPVTCLRHGAPHIAPVVFVHAGQGLPYGSQVLQHLSTHQPVYSTFAPEIIGDPCQNFADRVRKLAVCLCGNLRSKFVHVVGYSFGGEQECTSELNRCV